MSRKISNYLAGWGLSLKTASKQQNPTAAGLENPGALSLCNPDAAETVRIREALTCGKAVVQLLYSGRNYYVAACATESGLVKLYCSTE